MGGGFSAAAACLPGSKVVVAWRNLPLLVSYSRSATTRRCVKVADPVAGDLTAFQIGEIEGDAVSTLELHVLACEDKVWRLRRGSRGDGRGFGIDLNVDSVGDVVDGGRVRGWKCGLDTHKPRNNALKKGLGVDDGDAAERRMGGRFPIVVAEDHHLERVVGDGKFEQRAGPFLARRIGVVHERGDGDVDRFSPRINEGDHLFAFHLSFDLVVEVRLVLHVDVERWFVCDEVVGNVWLCALILEDLRARLGKGGWHPFDVLRQMVVSG
jgi:hypothetical protein